MTSRVGAVSALLCALLTGSSGALAQAQSWAPYEPKPTLVRFGQTEPPAENLPEPMLKEMNEQQPGYYYEPSPDGTSFGYECGDGCSHAGTAGYNDGCFLRELAMGGSVRKAFRTPAQFVIGMEYLYASADFSEAVAYVETNTEDIAAPFQRVHQLDFDHDDSFRFYGGYRLCNCDEEFRFSFTRLNSHARTVVPDPESTGIAIDVPLEVVPLPDGGRVFITADVDLESYDLGMSKTIPLGSPLCGGCPNGCGGCDPCGCNWCPAWDLTWYGGIRFADVEWRRRYFTVDDEDELVTDAHSEMSFEGGGARAGLEGRRYFGCTGAVSIFLKGDISLLLGNLDLVTQRESNQTPGQVTEQSTHVQHVIPVTEIEGGLTACLTSNTTLSAGYFLSAWHDLGFREEFPPPDNFGMGYDDANILGFDGWFLRCETKF